MLLNKRINDFKTHSTAIAEKTQRDLKQGASPREEFNLRFKRRAEKHGTKDLYLVLCDLGYVTTFLWSSAPSGQNKRFNNT